MDYVYLISQLITEDPDIFNEGSHTAPQKLLNDNTKIVKNAIHKAFGIAHEEYFLGKGWRCETNNGLVITYSGLTLNAVKVKDGTILHTQTSIGMVPAIAQEFVDKIETRMSSTDQVPEVKQYALKHLGQPNKTKKHREQTTLFYPGFRILVTAHQAVMVFERTRKSVQPIDFDNELGYGDTLDEVLESAFFRFAVVVKDQGYEKSVEKNLRMANP